MYVVTDRLLKNDFSMAELQEHGSLEPTCDCPQEVREGRSIQPSNPGGVKAKAADFFIILSRRACDEGEQEDGAGLARLGIIVDGLRGAGTAVAFEQAIAVLREGKGP